MLTSGGLVVEVLNLRILGAGTHDAGCGCAVSEQGEQGEEVHIQPIMGT